MADEATLDGGCHCGALRYCVRGTPDACGYCHCRICQRTTGAPVLSWTTFPLESFDYVTGSPTVYRSSAEGQREFCGNCGAQIAFRQDLPSQTIDLNTATFDEPTPLHPTHHIWTASRIAWFETADDFPRFEGDEPGPACE
jgi:hypothetical protein